MIELNEYIKLRTEQNKELTHRQLDENFLYVANPWNPNRFYKKGMIVYYYNTSNLLTWFIAKEDIPPSAIFDYSKWESIGGGNNLQIEDSNNIINDINKIKFSSDFNILFNNLNAEISLNYNNIIANIPKQVLSPYDKSWISLSVTQDGGLASNDGISETPIDGSYVAVFYNGQELEVGDGVTSKPFYFSGDGGITPKSFFSTHPNGKIQQGDKLYFNPSIAGFSLEANNRISLLYIIER